LCEEACPVGAITPDNDRRIDIKKCLGVDCSRCVQVCPQKAFEVVGYEITAEELYEELAKYRIFYDHSGGGVTLTGGEPLHQLEFTVEALRLCQQGGIQTAIETSLYADYEDVWKAAQHCDVLLCDIKHMDDDKHRRGTGVPNELILENFKRLNQDYKKDIAIRIALIPGYNDDEENVTRTMEFVNPLQQVKGVDLLPFNVFPIAKYNALSWDWEYKGVKGQSGEHLARLEEIVKSYKRFRCTIGGLW
jgi:pyruvate formate lyase activating enzyme